jgi:dihydroorotase
MSVAPARILGLTTGVRVGLEADLTLIDPLKEWVVTKQNIKSKSKNTPFETWTLRGQAVMTLVGAGFGWIG